MRTPDDNPNRPGAHLPGSRPLNGEIVPAAAVERPAPSPVPPAIARQFPSMGELLQGLRRCWLRAAVFGVLLGAAAATGAWFAMPLLAKTRARTMLLVQNDGGIVFHHQENMLAFLSYKKTQIALVKSRIVLNAALRKPDKSPVANLPMIKQRQLDPVEWLEGQIQVDYSAGPDILTISMSGDDGDQLKQIVKAVTTAYMEEIVDKQRRQRADQQDELEHIKERYAGLLEVKRKNLQEILDSKDNAGEHQKVAAELDSAMKQLAGVQAELRTIQAAATEEAAGTVPEKVVEEQVDSDSQVHEIRQAVAKLEKDLADLKQNTDDAHFPALSQGIQARLDQAKKELEARRAKVGPLIRDQFKTQLQARAAVQQGRVKALKRLQELVDKDLKSMTDAQRSLATKKADNTAAGLRAEIEQMEDVWRRVSAQVEVFKVEKEDSARIQPLEARNVEDIEPVVTHPDVYKRQLGGAVGGGLAGLLLVAFGLSWWECRSQRINSPDEVVRGLGMKLMGTLPLLPHRRRGGQASLDWESLLLESVDSIRTMLLHVARSEQLRVVMVSSAVSGEGKTSLSSHLATSLARAGRRTLLVDCDLRRPSLGRVFDLPGEAGFCDLLRGEAGLDEVVQPTQVDGLWVLPAGACCPVALSGLAHGGAGAILAQLRQQYEFVIVDSAPVLPVTDSLLVAQEVDGVLFSILRDVSRLGRVHNAYQRLAFLGVRILGAVVTGAPQEDLYDREYRYVGQGSANRALASEPEAGADDDGPASEEPR